MKTSKLIIIVFAFIYANCCNQEEKCNQRVYTKWLKNKIPSSICIDKNHHIKEILSQEDIDGDGLNDFIISHSKVNTKDKDTLFVSLCTQKKDSTYLLKKTLGNLYPIILDDYGVHIYITDTISNKRLVSYHGMYPFEKLEFLKTEIVLKIEVGAGETMEFHFTYRKDDDNWFLEWAEYYGGLTRQAEELLRADGVLNDFKPTIKRIDFQKEEQIRIDDFNYFDWL